MENNKSPNENNKSAKRDIKFLNLRLKQMRKSYNNLRCSYDKMLRQYKICEPRKQYEVAIPCVSLNVYASRRGMSADSLRNKLKKASILFVDRGISFLIDPQRYGHLVLYKQYPALPGLEKTAMYWNEAGVEFLNEFVQKNYRHSPKKDFSF